MTNLRKLYQETKMRLYGFYDDCEAEHDHVLREMEKIMNADKIDPMQPGADPQPIVPTLDKLYLPNCIDCEYAKKSALTGWDYAKCTHPQLPINLVTGVRVFPCVIARGYEQLCGPTGLFFLRRR